MKTLSHYTSKSNECKLHLVLWDCTNSKYSLPDVMIRICLFTFLPWRLSFSRIAKGTVTKYNVKKNVKIGNECMFLLTIFAYFAGKKIFKSFCAPSHEIILRYWNYTYICWVWRIQYANLTHFLNRYCDSIHRNIWNFLKVFHIF